MTQQGGSGSGSAIICGGSMAGLFAGLQLLRLGWDVAIYERSGEELASRGAGIATHQELFDALAACGLDLDRSLGISLPGRLTVRRDGSLLGRHPLRQVMTSWDRLYRVLRQGFPEARYHAGRRILGFEQDEAGVSVFLDGGARTRADLLIAADGFRSGLRARLLPAAVPQYAGYVAWRGLLEEAHLAPHCSRDFMDWFGFCLPAREQMLGYLVAGADDDLRAGHRRYNWVWYRPAEAESRLDDLLTDDEGQHHAMAIPPNKVRAQVVAQMRADAERLLAPAFIQAVKLTRRPFFQPIYDLECPQLVFGRVILVGDAAFVGRPHLGMGVTKAAADAVALAEALRTQQGIDAALARWEAPRLRYGRAVVQRNRDLGAEMGAGPYRWPEADCSARAQEVMSTVAVTLDLRNT